MRKASRIPIGPGRRKFDIRADVKGNCAFERIGGAGTMEKGDKIYVCGHRGMDGGISSAGHRRSLT